MLNYANLGIGVDLVETDDWFDPPLGPLGEGSRGYGQEDDLHPSSLGRY